MYNPIFWWKPRKVLSKWQNDVLATSTQKKRCWTTRTSACTSAPWVRTTNLLCRCQAHAIDAHAAFSYLYGWEETRARRSFGKMIQQRAHRQQNWKMGVSTSEHCKRNTNSVIIVLSLRYSNYKSFEEDRPAVHMQYKDKPVTAICFQFHYSHDRDVQVQMYTSPCQVCCPVVADTNRERSTSPPMKRLKENARQDIYSNEIDDTFWLHEGCPLKCTSCNLSSEWRAGLPCVNPLDLRVHKPCNLLALTLSLCIVAPAFHFLKRDRYM